MPVATRPPGIGRQVKALAARARELQATQELWNLDKVFAVLGIARDDRKTRWRMRTALTNYAVVGVTTWPPTPEIRTRRMDGDGPGLQWWPPHVSVLPPPEVRDDNEPLFLSGAVYKYAMTVGRMTLDGQPIIPKGGQGEVRHSPPAPPPPPVDIARWRELVSDTTLDNVEDISRESGISLATLWHCYRAARSLRSGAIAWPPNHADARRAHPQPKPGARIIRHWPATDVALPPPQGIRRPDGHDVRYQVVPVPHSRHPWLWERGVWRRWAMTTGRMPVPLLVSTQQTQAGEQA